MSISDVEIVEGCILDGICVEICPEVFEMGPETAEVIEDADFDANEDCIRESADECPVDVIIVEE